MSARKTTRGRRSSEAATAASQAPVAAPPQQFLQVVKNLLGQNLTISLLDEEGEGASTETILAHGLSRAVRLDRISPYTHRLVDRGYARIIQAPRS